MSELIGYLSEVEHLEGELTIPKQLGGSTLGTKTITENDTYYAEDDGLDGYSEVTVNVSGGGGTLETITKTYTPTTSQQTEQITPSSGYDGIAEVDVTVNAMPTGTEGTPTATKGSVSNHSVNVTPSVTNVAGYIAGGTKTGTAVTVSASELDSGTKSITANGTNQDVIGYAAVDVAVPNTYSAADEGKVVSSGALVAQTAHADVTPTASDQTIDTTTNNSIKVKGDADLVAGNIKKDVEIFGVTGSYEGGGGGTQYEISEITLASKQNATVTIPHTLGRMPNFAMIILKTAEKLAADEDRYRIALLMCNFSLGADDYNTSTNLTVYGRPIFVSFVNNNNAMYTSQTNSSSTVSTRLMSADSSNVYVGYNSGAVGHLGATTYVVVIG